MRLRLKYEGLGNLSKNCQIDQTPPYCTLAPYALSCLEPSGHLLKPPVLNLSCGFSFVPTVNCQMF